MGFEFWGKVMERCKKLFLGEDAAYFWIVLVFFFLLFFPW